MLIDIDVIVSEGNVRLDGGNHLANLVQSMEAVGQLVPVTVQQWGSEGQFLLVAGHRRLEAARRLGWTQIEGYVLDSSAKPLLAQVTENVARRDLTVYELAQGVLALQVETGLKQDEIASALGLPKKEVSQLQKIARGTAGLDPVGLNNHNLFELEHYGEIHDMPDEMRERFIEAHDGGKESDQYWLTNNYIREVQVWRWSRKKENRALIKALEDTGAVPMESGEERQAKALYNDSVQAHRGQPCHGYRIGYSYSRGGDNFEIQEYCLDPQSHVSSEDKKLKAMSEDAKAKGIGGTVKERAKEKERKARKVQRKEAVLAFSKAPKIRDLTEMLYVVVRQLMPAYKWQELGKTFGLTKPADTYHFDWDEDYLSKFAGKDRLIQELILGIGSLYIGMEGSYGRYPDSLVDLDRLFGLAIPKPEEDEISYLASNAGDEEE
jgi:hypothetical protein